MYAPILLIALPAAVRSLWVERGRRSLFAWYLLSASAILFLSREIWSRHLLYLVPAICVLFAYALVPLLNLRGKGILLLAVIGAVLIPWVLEDHAQARVWEQVEDWRLADYVAAHTSPDDLVLADYSDLPFYARRKTTYSGAELSYQHTSSGQIRGRDLMEEIEAGGVKMIALGTSWDADHRHLWDRDQFMDYLEANFRYQGSFRRSSESTYQIYTAPDLPPRGPALNFEGILTLLSADLDRTSAPAGGQVGVQLRWKALQALPEDYAAFLHLKDRDGFLWGQGDKPLTDSLQRATSEWLPDEIDVDRYTIRIPPGTPPGDYEPTVGLYRLADLSRLNILDSSGSPVGTEHVIGEVLVTRPPTLPSPELLEIPHPLGAELGGTVRLLGYAGLDGETAPAGETIPLSLFWEALRDIPTKYDLRLELRGNGGRLAGSRLLPPACEGFPTDRRRKGEIVRGRYDLVVDAAAAAGDYQLQVNWENATTGQPVAEEDVPLGHVRVAELERRYEIPPISHPLQADLGGSIALLGYDLETSRVEPGERVNLILYWQAKGRVPASYTVFTHLLDSEQRIWGQRDRIPLEGTRPTTGFLPGEVIADAYAIPVDGDAPPGEYVLEIGMYDALSGERLPVVIDGSPVPGDRALVSTILIEPERTTNP